MDRNIHSNNSPLSLTNSSDASKLELRQNCDIQSAFKLINLSDLSVIGLSQWILDLPRYKTQSVHRYRQSTDKDLDENKSKEDAIICEKLSRYLYENQINGRQIKKWKLTKHDFAELMSCLNIHDHESNNDQYDWIWEILNDMDSPNSSTMSLFHPEPTFNSLNWMRNSWKRYMIIKTTVEQQNRAASGPISEEKDMEKLGMEQLQDKDNKADTDTNSDLQPQLSLIPPTKDDDDEEPEIHNATEDDKEKQSELQGVGSHKRMGSGRSVDAEFEIMDKSFRRKTSNVGMSSPHHIQIQRTLTNSSSFDGYGSCYGQDVEKRSVDEILWKRSAELLQKRVDKTESDRNKVQKNNERLQARLERKKSRVESWQQEIQKLLDDYKHVKQENKRLKQQLMNQIMRA